MKLHRFFFLLTLSCALLCACGSEAAVLTDESSSSSGSGSLSGSADAGSGVPAAWYDDFSLETDKISIYYASGESYEELTLTDAAQLEKLADAVHFSTWEEVSPEDEYSAVPDYFIDFHNGTVISSLKDVSYGSVGTDVKLAVACADDGVERCTVSLENAQGPFTQDTALLQAVQEVFAENLAGCK